VLCAPETAIREAAQRMSAAPASSVVVERGDGTVGILTDRDLACEVFAEGLPGQTPLAEVMTDQPVCVEEGSSLDEVIGQVPERQPPGIPRRLR